MFDLIDFIAFWVDLAGCFQIPIYKVVGCDYICDICERYCDICLLLSLVCHDATNE